MTPKSIYPASVLPEDNFFWLEIGGDLIMESGTWAYVHLAGFLSISCKGKFVASPGDKPIKFYETSPDRWSFIQISDNLKKQTTPFDATKTADGRGWMIE